MKNNGLLIFSTICFLITVFSKCEIAFKIVISIIIYVSNLVYYIYLIKKNKKKF
jgi:hypothetical protein